jgi:hypothetical protein
MSDLVASGQAGCSYTSCISGYLLTLFKQQQSQSQRMSRRQWWPIWTMLSLMSVRFADATYWNHLRSLILQYNPNEIE